MIKESYEIKLVIFSRNKLFIFFVWVCLYYIVIIIVPWKWEGLKLGFGSFTFLPADTDPPENALKFEMLKSPRMIIIKLERELYLNLASEQGNNSIFWQIRNPGLKSSVVRKLGKTMRRFYSRVSQITYKF